MTTSSNDTNTNDTNTPAALMRTFAQLAGEGDAVSLLALYEPDAVFQPAPGISLRGHAEIRPAITDLAGLRPTITYNGDPDVVVVGDLALVSNSWTMNANLPDGTVMRQGGVSADVVRRQVDGRWLVLIDQPRGVDQSA